MEPHEGCCDIERRPGGWPMTHLECTIRAAVGRHPWQALLEPDLPAGWDDASDCEVWRWHDGHPTMGVCRAAAERILFALITDPDEPLPVHRWWMILLGGDPDDPPASTTPDRLRPPSPQWREWAAGRDVDDWLWTRLLMHPSDTAVATSTGWPDWTLTGLDEGPANDEETT